MPRFVMAAHVAARILKMAATSAVRQLPRISRVKRQSRSYVYTARACSVARARASSAHLRLLRLGQPSNPVVAVASEPAAAVSAPTLAGGATAFAARPTPPAAAGGSGPAPVLHSQLTHGPSSRGTQPHNAGRPPQPHAASSRVASHRTRDP